jgi:hypothetical protein
MFIKNKTSHLLKLAILSTAILSSIPVIAETAPGSTASVVVQNSFTVAETTPLSFGTVVAFANNNSSVTNDVATLVVSANPATADVIANGATAKLVTVVAGTPATFTISGAAPNTALTITPPAGFLLSDPSATDSKDFGVGTFTTFVTTSGTPFTFDTDGGGGMVFNMGATLTTDAALATANVAIAYSSVTFTNTYTMTVNY